MIRTTRPGPECHAPTTMQFTCQTSHQVYATQVALRGLILRQKIRFELERGPSVLAAGPRTAVGRPIAVASLLDEV